MRGKSTRSGDAGASALVAMQAIGRGVYFTLEHRGAIHEPLGSLVAAIVDSGEESKEAGFTRVSSCTAACCSGVTTDTRDGTAKAGLASGVFTTDARARSRLAARPGSAFVAR